MTKWLAVMLFFPAIGLGATDGPHLATAGANDSNIGTSAWSNPSFITATDASKSSNTISGGLEISNYIVGSGFAFTCPASSVIEGIEVSADKTQPNPAPGGARNDYSIILVVGTSSSTNKSTGSQWSTTDSYGGPGDLWGLGGLTCADMATLQVKMAAQADGDTLGAAIIGIGDMSVTLYTVSSAVLSGFIDPEDTF